MFFGVAAVLFLDRFSDLGALGLAQFRRISCDGQDAGPFGYAIIDAPAGYTFFVLGLVITTAWGRDVLHRRWQQLRNFVRAELTLP